MFENPKRGRQARNVLTNVPKILDLKSSSEHILGNFSNDDGDGDGNGNENAKKSNGFVKQNNKYQCDNFTLCTRYFLRSPYYLIYINLSKSFYIFP